MSDTFAPADERLELLAEIGGEPYAPEARGETPCPGQHSPMIQNLVAFIEGANEEDEGRWEMRVRIICAACPAHFEIDRVGRAPRDGGHGVVLTMRPTLPA